MSSGRISRSSLKVKVKGQGQEVKNIHWDYPLTSETESLVYQPAKEETKEYNWKEYDVGCFQSVCGFLTLIRGSQRPSN